MVKQCPLIVTAYTAEITQESAAAGHHFWKSNLLRKLMHRYKEKGKNKKADVIKIKKRSLLQGVYQLQYVSFVSFLFPSNCLFFGVLFPQAN